MRSPSRGAARNTTLDCGSLIGGIRPDLTNVSVFQESGNLLNIDQKFFQKKFGNIPEGGDKVFERGTLGI